VASTLIFMPSTSLLDSVTYLKRCYNAAQNNPANSDVYRSISVLRNAELLENFWRRHSLSVQSEITRDHLDFHAPAREKLARQLLLRVSTPRFYSCFIPHPPTHQLPSSLPAVVSASCCLQLQYLPVFVSVALFTFAMGYLQRQLSLCQFRRLQELSPAGVLTCRFIERLTKESNLPFAIVSPQERREEEMRQHLQTLMSAEAPRQKSSERIPEL